MPIHDISTDQQPYMIVEEAVRDRSWMKNPELITTLTAAELASKIHIIELPGCNFCKELRFFAVTDPTQKPGTNSIVIALSESKKTRRIAAVDGLERLLKENHVSITSEKEALSLAELYIRIFGTQYPQYWSSMKILSSYQDIPLREEEILPEELQSEIGPPKVKKSASNYLVDVFVWTELGGILCHFFLTISPAGEIAAQSRLLREGLGRNWLPK